MLASAAWQLLFGWLMLAAGMFAYEGVPQLWPLPAHVAGLDRLQRPDRHGARLFPLVRGDRPTAGDDRLARLAAGAGGRRHRLGRDARRAADLADIIGFALHLRRGGQRAAAAEREARRNAE